MFKTLQIQNVVIFFNFYNQKLKSINTEFIMMIDTIPHLFIKFLMFFEMFT